MPLSLNGSGGITWPDGTVNATRAVSTAGDTMTGNLSLPSLSGTNVTASNLVNVNPATLGSTAGSKTVLYRSTQLTGGGNTTGLEVAHVRTSAGTTWNTVGVRVGSWTDVTDQAYIEFNGDNDNGVKILTNNGGLQPSVRITGNGFMTKPYQPTALVTFTTAYNSFTWGSDTVIVFDAVDSANNVGSMYNTSNGRFTAPVAGWYQIYCNMMLAPPSTNSNRMVLKRNGSDFKAASLGSDVIQPANQVSGLGNNQSFVTLTAIVKLAAGDYLQVASRSGSSLGNVYGGHCWAYCYLMH
jgi:hypothetical protein